MSKEITLEIQPVGMGTTATVSAKMPDGTAVFCDKFDVAKAKWREEFIKKLRDRLGKDADRLLNTEEVERELVAAAAQFAAPPKTATPADGVELDDGRVVRPERFILPDVSGIAIPRKVERPSGVVSEWTLYLRWQDGRREAIPLPEMLEVGGERVFIHPKPPEPPPSMLPGWSAASRAEWLAGSNPMPPDEVCQRLIKGFAKYLDLPPETAYGTVATLACWSLLTYLTPAFPAVPYISVSGPMGSGKSRILELLRQLVFRPMSTSSTSEAVIYRSLDAFGHTALLDEAERLRDPDMQRVVTNLLDGHKRGGTASRCDPDAKGHYMPKYFSVFGCKAFAAINEVPPTLASRSIAMPMFRSLKDSKKPRLRIEDDAASWQRLRDALHILALEHGSDWLALPARQDVVPEMSGRAFEVWQPLLGLAAWFDDHGTQGLLDLLQEHALMLIEQGRETATPQNDEILLQVLARMRSSGIAPKAAELLAAARQQEPSRFKDWSTKGVSACLRRYGLSSRKSNGDKIFSPSPADLWRIQEAYEVDLDQPSDLDSSTDMPRQWERQGT